ncbi:peptidylprolyl isomerase [Sphingomonas corticis]|jgi:peptidyl-prolyl cis-trans isomerase A (cyclophilin A)|uniref:peptidylprolyl isomerase n=1 Tax=Sphingomonas corticis TaxID=2722791 RepID=A0ABX1CM64_9SPHN|nr:peptidylprolyl isomerase [Sphingomonas corticis]NJR79033.1 peptidylprolyl isomerase [Sphingomonas corticis]
MLLALALAAAQVAPPAPVPSPSPTAAVQKVTLATEAGPITIAVEIERAPVTAANFLRYVDQKKLDGVAFYRAMNLAPGYGLVQFGTRNDPRRTLPPIAHEPTAKTGLSHVDGAISMAMAKPGTAAGDFFVVVGDIKTMDASAADPGFAVFGRVLEGMDVIRRIMASPTSPTLGEGVMKGQMLAPVVKVATARRVP